MMNKKDEIEALKKENYLLKKIINEIPASIYWKNTDGVYLGRNSYAAQKMVEQGFEETENKDFVVGKSDHDLFPPAIAKEFRDNDLMILASGQETMVEESFLSQTDKLYHHFSIKKPLYDEAQQSLGIVGISIDISERKGAEERERLALTQVEKETVRAQVETELRQAVMIFAGSLAHDLRTLIATLHLNTRTIKKGLTEECHSVFPLLQEKQTALEMAIQRMRGIIDSSLAMLRYAFKNESMPQDALVRCSMWHCLHNTLTYYPFLEGERDLIMWDEQDFHFNGNEVPMIRVLSNLLENALYQIRQKGQGRILINTKINADSYVLCFRDTAGGVSSELPQQLFTGYDTTKPEGTGVGLAFCKLALQQFGASIGSHFVAGGFIEFELTFPRHETS